MGRLFVKSINAGKQKDRENRRNYALRGNIVLKRYFGSKVSKILKIQLPALTSYVCTAGTLTRGEYLFSHLFRIVDVRGGSACSKGSGKIYRIFVTCSPKVHVPPLPSSISLTLISLPPAPTPLSPLSLSPV